MPINCFTLLGNDKLSKEFERLKKASKKELSEHDEVELATIVALNFHKDIVKRLNEVRANSDEKLLSHNSILKDISKQLKDSKNAIPKPSTGEVLQRQQSGNGEQGGERRRVESSVKGESTTTESKQTEKTTQAEQGGGSGGSNAANENEGSGNENISGVKKSVTNAIREELGLPKVELPKMGNDIEELQKAKERVDNGESNPRDIVDRILSDKNGYKNEDEVMDMQYYAHQLKIRNEELTSQIGESENIVDKSELVGKKQQLSDELDRQTEAAQIAGSKWGKIGNMMQPVIDLSFDPSREKLFIKEAYDGEIPKDVQEKISSLTIERDTAISERSKIEKKLSEALSKKAEKRIKSEAKKSKLAETKEQLVKEEKDLLTQLKAAFKKDSNNLNAGIPLPKETLEVLGKLAVNYFKQGVVSIEAIANKIHSQLKDDTDISKDDIKDFLSEYEPLTSEKEISRLNTKAQGIEDKITPTTIKTNNGEISGANTPTDFNAPTKKVLEFRKNSEWVKANQRVANAEYEFRKLKRQAFESQKNMYQKGLMWAGRMFRLSILSGYNVLAKLSAAATIGGAGKRIPEQAIGAIYSKIFKGVASKAPIEGGYNVDAEVKFYKEFFNPKKFYKNSLEILKTGSSDLSKKFGGDEYEHVPLLYLPTDLHQIIKDPLKRGTFESAFKYGIKNAAKNGLDINDPLIIQTIENAAYKRAKYEIFQESNAISKWVNEKKQKLDKGGNAGATGKFLVDFMLPVSTVPTNIASRLVTTSPLGLSRGAAKTFEAYRKGIENLKPEEADVIMRQLKQGTLGTALWMAGWFGASYLGGLYSKYDPNKKRLEGELPSDEMMVDGKMIPKPVQHALPLEIMQLAATSRHIYDNYKDNKGSSSFEAITNAGLGSIGAVAEKIPVIATGALAVESTVEPYKAEKLKEDISRRFKPQILTETGVIGNKKDAKQALLERNIKDGGIFRNDMKVYDENGKRRLPTVQEFQNFKDKRKGILEEKLNNLYEGNSPMNLVIDKTTGKPTKKSYDDMTEAERFSAISSIKIKAFDEAKDDVFGKKKMSAYDKMQIKKLNRERKKISKNE
jgi:hypothetical protein